MNYLSVAGRVLDKIITDSVEGIDDDRTQRESRPVASVLWGRDKKANHNLKWRIINEIPIKEVTGTQKQSQKKC